LVATYTPGSGTNRDRVRLLTTDTDVANAIFQDAEIDDFLALEADDVRLAAAQALDVIASSEALVLKVMKLLDLQTDGAKVAEALRAHAKELRRQVAEGCGDMTGLWDIAEMPVDVFAQRERLLNQALREA
jgi:hypothetical protein